jgi:hypothetical protein
MAGNVNEWVLSSLDPSEAVIRGGGFYYAPMTARSTKSKCIEQQYSRCGNRNSEFAQKSLYSREESGKRNQGFLLMVLMQ